MAVSEIEKEYAEVLEKSRLKGELDEGKGGANRRVHPRIKVQSTQLSIDTVPEFFVADISLSGLAVITNHPLAPGESVHISLGEAMSVDAEVVNCQMEEPPSEMLDAQFRVQCKFSEQYKGMELLVRVKRMEN